MNLRIFNPDLETQTMSPIEKLQNEFPAEVLAEMQGVVAKCKANYDARLFDYFEYMEGCGNAIKQVGRGTQEWNVRMEALKQSSVEACCLIDVEAWHSHLTGEREATHEYPGWHFVAYREVIRDAIRDTLHTYALNGISQEAYDEWQDKVANHLQINDEILDECVDFALAGTA